MKKLNKTLMLVGGGVLALGAVAGTTTGVWFALENSRETSEHVNPTDCSGEYVPLKELAITNDRSQWDNSMIFEFKPIINGAHTTNIDMWTRVIANKDGLNTFNKNTGKLVHRPEWNVAGDFTGGFMYQWPERSEVFAGTKTGLYRESKRKVKLIKAGDFTGSTMIRINYKNKGEMFAVYRKDGFHLLNPKTWTFEGSILPGAMNIQTSLAVSNKALENRLLVGTDIGMFWIEQDATGDLKKTKIANGNYKFISQVPQWEDKKLNGKIDLYFGLKSGLSKATIPKDSTEPKIESVNKKLDLTNGFVGYTDPTDKEDGMIYVGTNKNGLLRIRDGKFENILIKPEWATDNTYVHNGFIATSVVGTIVGTHTGIYDLKDSKVYGIKQNPIQATKYAQSIYK